MSVENCRRWKENVKQLRPDVLKRCLFPDYSKFPCLISSPVPVNKLVKDPVEI